MCRHLNKILLDGGGALLPFPPALAEDTFFIPAVSTRKEPDIPLPWKIIIIKDKYL